MFRNGLEPWHLIILLAIILLMFGSTKLPELARGMGRSIRIFKSEMDEGKTGKTGASDDADQTGKVDAEPAQIEGKAEVTQAASIETARSEHQA